MNARRGLVRLWLVLSMAWIALVVCENFQMLRGQLGAYWNAAEYEWLDTVSEILMPTDCLEARGSLGVDYDRSPASTERGPWDAGGEPVTFCWYTIAAFRKLYPEYGDMSDAALINGLYEKSDIRGFKPMPDFWGQVVPLLVWIAFPILLPVAIGYLIVWVVAGFRATPSAKN